MTANFDDTSGPTPGAEVPAGSEVTTAAILAHAGFVRSLARGLLRDEAAVDDVVQETLMRALDRGPRRREALPAWLRTVVRNITYKRLRGRARRAAREEAVARPEALPAAGELVVRESALRDLTAAVLDLPEQAREAVLLRYFEGLSPAEIAERLGLPAGTVRMRLHRALVALRRRLDDSTGGDRRQWMGGLALLAGLSPEDAGGAAPAGTGGAVLAAAGAAALLAVGLLAVRGRDPGAGAVPASLARAAAPAAAEGGAGATEPDGAASGSVPGARVPAAVAGPAAAGERALPPARPATVALLGRVVDADGRGVEGATLLGAWGGSNLVARGRSGADGWFELPVELAAAAVVEELPVLLAAAADGHAPSAVVDVHELAGEAGRGPVLRLRGPGARLAGTVQDARDDPIAGAVVEVGERLRLGLGVMGPMTADEENPLAPQLAARVERIGRPSFPGHRYMRGTLGAQVLAADGTRSRQPPARPTRTDARGAFELDGLEPSASRIFVSAPGFAPARLRQTLVAGATTRIQVTLEREARAEGRIVRADGLPAGPILVHAFVEEPWTVRTVRAAADGAFALGGLPAGLCRLVAEQRDGDALVARAEALVSLEAGEVTGWDGALVPAARRVMQLVGGGAPLAGWRVEVRAEHNVASVLDRKESDDAGRVVLADRYPVDAALYVFPPTRDWVLPALVSRAPLAPTAGAVDATGVRRVEVEVAPARQVGTTLRGRLQTCDGRPLATGTELLLLQPGQPAGVPARIAGPDGAFEIGPVPPGRYRLVAPLVGLGATFEETLDVGGGGTLELGDLRLPELGALRLEPADGRPGWSDLELVHFVGDGLGAERLIVFDGRVELPATLRLSPGRYAALFDDARPGNSVGVRITRGRTTTLRWPR